MDTGVNTDDNQNDLSSQNLNLGDQEQLNSNSSPIITIPDSDVINDSEPTTKTPISVPEARTRSNTRPKNHLRNSFRMKSIYFLPSLLIQIVKVIIWPMIS